MGGKTRYVPLAAPLFDEFDRYAASFAPGEVTLPWGSAEGELVTASLLITHLSGGAFSGDLFTKIAWKPAFATLEYRKRVDGTHALRHLYASTLLARGVSVKVGYG